MNKWLIYTDATFNQRGEVAGISNIFCRRDGKIIGAAGTRIAAKTVQEAELRSILWALKRIPPAAKDVVICNDNRTVVRCLRHKGATFYSEPLMALLKETREELKKHNASIMIKWLPREENAKADAVARNALFARIEFWEEKPLLQSLGIT